MSPKEQGDLDALCGVYAIVNAFTYVGVNDRFAKHLFKRAIQGLAKSRWPDVLFEGTYFKDLKKMIQNCQKSGERSGALQVQVSYPLEEDVPANDASYWQRFDEFFAQNTAGKCAIIGLPHHWMVVVPHGTSKLMVIDSDASNSMKLIQRNRFSAHDRSPSADRIKIVRNELVLFEMKA